MNDCRSKDRMTDIENIVQEGKKRKETCIERDTDPWICLTICQNQANKLRILKPTSY